MITTNKILLIATRQIGDVLLVTPLLHTLRRAYPQAVIDVLVYANKGGMLQGNRDCNQIISIAEHPTIKEYLQLFQCIWRRYDLAISTLAGDRPLAYAFLAAKRRIAIVPPYRWQDAWKRWFVNAWIELDNETTHTVIQNLRLADLLNIPRCYEIKTPTTHRQLSEILPFDWKIKPYAVLHLLPMWQYKRWTMEGWVALAHYLSQQRLQVVLTGSGSKTEMEYLLATMSQMPKSVLSLAGQLDFGEVAIVLKHCKVFVGPDTAVTHLAAASGAPTVALYGPTNPLKWSPWPAGYSLDKNPFFRKGTRQINRVLLLQPEGTCVPCHQEGCYLHKQSDSQCLKNLSATQVIAAVDKVMRDCGS